MLFLVSLMSMNFVVVTIFIPNIGILWIFFIYHSIDSLMVLIFSKKRPLVWLAFSIVFMVQFLWLCPYLYNLFSFICLRYNLLLCFFLVMFGRCLACWFEILTFSIVSIQCYKFFFTHCFNRIPYIFICWIFIFILFFILLKFI